MAEQLGIFLHPNNGEVPPRHELRVPCPPASLAELDPKDYAHLLPGTVPAELTAALAPLSTKLGPGPLVIVYDQRFSPPGAERNRQATVLTAALATGFGEEIFGPALVFYAEAGKDFSGDDYNCLDDVIQNEVFGMFADGEVPTSADYERWNADMQCNRQYYQGGKYVSPHY